MNKVLGSTLAAFVVVLLLTACFWNPLVSWTDAHSGAASWAQAVGAVFAIFFAIGISAQQRDEDRRREERRERESSLRQMRVVIALAERAVWMIEAVPTPTTDPDITEKRLRDFDILQHEQMADILLKVGPADVPVGTALIQIQIIHDSLLKARAIGGSSLFSFLNQHLNEVIWPAPLLPVPDLQVKARAAMQMLRAEAQQFDQ